MDCFIFISVDLFVAYWLVFLVMLEISWNISEYQNNMDTNGLSPQPQEPDQAGLDEHNDSKSQVLS